MMKSDATGLYVHIPFCLKKCNYCDFCSFSGVGTAERAAYIDALRREIYGYRGRGIRADTVFFGGGTPSLLSPDEFLSVTEALYQSFDIQPGAEFTVEMNPKTETRERLAAYRSAGVNRISIGLQSIHKNELKKLGRIHSYDDFLRALDGVHSVVTDNVSADIMYGIPEQTAESFEETLRTVVTLGLTHISAYGLIIEEGTRFFRERDTLSTPDEEAERAMYFSAIGILGEYGFSHYEISNYAIPGYQCRHNLHYWHDDDYIGLGAAAYSCYDGVRFGNTAILADYVDGKLRSGDREIIDVATQAFEFAMLRLRLSEGFSLTGYREKFGKEFAHGKEERISLFSKLGLLRISGDRIALTDEGMYVSNNIMAELL